MVRIVASLRKHEIKGAGRRPTTSVPVPGGLRAELPQAPASLVVVWAEGPLLVHRTLVPALIVSEAGEKVKSWMVNTDGATWGLIWHLPPEVVRDTCSP